MLLHMAVNCACISDAFFCYYIMLAPRQTFSQSCFSSCALFFAFHASIFHRALLQVIFTPEVFFAGLLGHVAFRERRKEERSDFQLSEGGQTGRFNQRPLPFGVSRRETEKKWRNGGKYRREVSEEKTGISETRGGLLRRSPAEKARKSEKEEERASESESESEASNSVSDSVELAFGCNSPAIRQIQSEITVLLVKRAIGAPAARAAR